MHTLNHLILKKTQYTLNKGWRGRFSKQDESDILFVIGLTFTTKGDYKIFRHNRDPRRKGKRDKTNLDRSKIQRREIL